MQSAQGHTASKWPNPGPCSLDRLGSLPSLTSHSSIGSVSSPLPSPHAFGASVSWFRLTDCPLPERAICPPLFHTRLPKSALRSPRPFSKATSSRKPPSPQNLPPLTLQVCLCPWWKLLEELPSPFQCREHCRLQSILSNSQKNTKTQD